MRSRSWRPAFSISSLSFRCRVQKGVISDPIAKRADPVRVAKCNDSVTDDHCDYRITAAATFMHGLDRLKYGIRRQLGSRLVLQFVGKDVQQGFRGRPGIEMALILANLHCLQLSCVG